MANAAKISERMDVMGSDGNRLGIVDHVEGNAIKLTKSSTFDGQHHFVPMEWVNRVDQTIHLNKSCREAREEWQRRPLGAGGVINPAENVEPKK